MSCERSATRALAACALLVAVSGAGAAAAAVEEVRLPPEAKHPIAVAVDADGMVWTTLDTTWAVARHDPATGATDIVPLATDKGDEQYALLSMDVAPDGTVWTLSQRHLHRIDPIALTADAIELPFSSVLPGDVHVADDGVVWASFVTEDVIVRYDPATDALDWIGMPGKRVGPLEFSEGPLGTVMTATYAGTYVLFDERGRSFELGPRDLFAAPFGIAQVGRELWIAEHGANTVALHDPAANATERFPASQPPGSPPASAAGLIVARDGAVWFVEHFGDRVARLDADAGTLVEWDLPGGPVANAQQIAEAPDGSMWTAVWRAHSLVRVRYDGERPGFGPLPNVTVAQGASASIDVPLETSGVTGSSATGLRAGYAGGRVTVSAEDVAPGQYRVVVSDKHGNMNVGRFVTVDVTPVAPVPAVGAAGAAFAALVASAAAGVGMRARRPH